MISKRVHLSLVILLVAGDVLPQAPAETPAAPPVAPPAAPPAAPAILQEKTVYVPYEKLAQVFEKEGRGIFLPYEEFLKLWEAAQPKPPGPPPDVPPADAVIRGSSYRGSVEGDVARITLECEVEALKQGWSELPLAFRGVAIESVEISNPRALLEGKAAAEGASAYTLFLPEPGRSTVKFQFSVRVTREPARRTLKFGMPAAAVSRLELTIPEVDVRVEVEPALAVMRTVVKDGTTQVVAFFGNSSEVSLSWMPPPGKAADGGAVLFAEQSIHAHLGERILRISTDTDFQVLRGEVDSLRIRVPAGMRLISVKGENIREWTEAEGILTVKLHSALKDASRPRAGGGATAAYRLSMTFERILTDTPSSLSVPFPRVEDVIRESGWVILTHEAGLNTRVAATQGLSQLDRDEVPEAIRGEQRVAFRYLAHPLSLDLEVDRITPSIRSFTTSVIVLGREEDVWVGFVDYTISRAGVFRLELRVPSRWSVASIGDPAAVDNFQTTDADGARTITVSLKSKALGAFRLPFRLTAPGSAAAGEATHSPPLVVGSSEDRGLLGMSAPRAFELSTLQREKAVSADVDELLRSGILTQTGADSGMPLTYSYREGPASVRLRIEAKKTEVDVLAQHLFEISDGGIKATHMLDFEVLYAAIDRLTFSAPTSLDNVLKVEAKEKKEVRKVSTAGDRTTWEVVLQAPALGNVSVTLTHETDLKALEPGRPFPYAAPLIRSSGARAEKGFVAVRKEGTLEIVPQQANMEAIDAGDLPDKLRRGQIYSSFRYFSPEPSLTLTLTRYEYQPLASTVINLIQLKSVLSEERKLKTRATLFVQNTERQYLELALPPEAILSLSVAGKPQQPRKRKDGKGTLVQIPSSAGPNGTFAVVIVYEEDLTGGEMGLAGRAALRTPEVLEDVPVAKIELELHLPPEYTYLLWTGRLKQQPSGAPTLWSRFKRIVQETAAHAEPAQERRSQGEARPMAADPSAAAGAVDVEIPTRGLVVRSFDTMARSGTLEFTYVRGALFRFADFLAFAAALVAGWWLLARKRWPLLRCAVLLVFVPLALLWLSSGALGEIAASLLAGGTLALAASMLVRATRWLRGWRSARVAFAPDPFLEDAATVKDATPPPPPPAQGSGTEGGTHAS